MFGVGAMRTSATSLEPDVARRSACRSAGSLMLVDAVPRLRRAPDAARRRPCRRVQMSPTSSPAISSAAARRTSPGLTPYRCACCEIHLDLDLRDVRRRSSTFASTSPSIPSSDSFTSSAFCAQDVQVRRRRCARRCASLDPGQHLPDPLLAGTSGRRGRARGSRRRPPGLGERLVVVDLRVDADPVLAEVDADGLVGERAPGRCASRSCGRPGSRAAPRLARVR